MVERGRTIQLAIALAALAAWLCTALVSWAQHSPLGHDEAQYALAGRDFLAGAEPRWFFLSRGMEVITLPGLWLGGSDLALRFVPLLAGVAFVLATWLLARRSVGNWSAAWALLVVVGTRSLARRDTDLLSDVPAAACLIAALAVIVEEIDQPEGARWRLLLAAPLLAGALYVRYGSAVPIAVIVVAALAAGWRTVLKRPAPAIATALAFLLLLLPHFALSYRMFGSPLGLLRASRSVPLQGEVYSGLVEYLTSNPFVYYGIAAAPAMLVGILSFQTADRKRLFVWIVAVGTLIALGLTTQAMPRYVITSTALLVVLGVDRAVRWIAVLPTGPRRVLAVVATLGVVAVWLTVTLRVAGSGDYHRRAMRGTLTAVDVIRRDAAGRPCMVIGYHSTQLEWYSGCAGPTADAAGHRVYVVRDRTPNWTPARQPNVSDIPGTPVTLVSQPELDVVRVDPPNQ